VLARGLGLVGAGQHPPLPVPVSVAIDIDAAAVLQPQGVVFDLLPSPHQNLSNSLH
jgi:hypothetical protein